MSDSLTVRIKQQPFDPPFVIEIDGQEAPASIGKSYSGWLLANIHGKGTYKINVSDVGFFFVEREAVAMGNGVLPGIPGAGKLNRISRSVAEVVGEHCGDVWTELKTVQSILLLKRP